MIVILLSESLLQINVSTEIVFVYDEFNLIVARERRGQDDLRLSGIYHRRVDHITILILYIKNIIRMISLKQQRVVVNVNNRSRNWSPRETISYRLFIYNTHS